MPAGFVPPHPLARNERLEGGVSGLGVSQGGGRGLVTGARTALSAHFGWRRKRLRLRRKLVVLAMQSFPDNSRTRLSALRSRFGNPHITKPLTSLLKTEEI